MAVKFLDPGGDAMFGASPVGNFELFDGINNGSPSIVSDIIHGGHLRSTKINPNNTSGIGKAGIFADAGGRISFYLYFNALPNSITDVATIQQTGGGTTVVNIRVTSGGVLRLYNNTTQIGTNGPTLSTGTWYRISLAYTISSTSVNRFELFKDGVSAISVTNATLGVTGAADLNMGMIANDLSADFRLSDIYVDDSNALTDPGNIWVTAKRPVSNGSANQWTTQIGAGSSGYGTGHAPQVNERPSSNSNGWSITSASLLTEEYSIEGKSVGDIDISSATIVDFMGWVDTKVGVAGATANIILAGSASNISVQTTERIFTKVAGSSTYPAGNTDIGMNNNSVNQLFSLYECGIVVAYTPSTTTPNGWLAASNQPVFEQVGITSY